MLIKLTVCLLFLLQNSISQFLVARCKWADLANSTWIDKRNRDLNDINHLKTYHLQLTVFTTAEDFTLMHDLPLTKFSKTNMSLTQWRRQQYDWEPSLPSLCRGQFSNLSKSGTLAKPPGYLRKPNVDT